MSFDSSRVRAICIDVDGTLRDTDDLMVEKFSRWMGWISTLLPSFKPRRLARRLVMALEDPGNIILQIPDLLGIDDEIAALGNYFSRLGLIKPPKQHSLIPGTEQALKELYIHYPLAIVSARGARTTEAFLDHYSLRSYFHCIVTAQTCRFTKPQPHPILYAAQAMNVSPHQCLMIGDTRVDILAGVRAGAQTVGVLCGFGEQEELLRAGANLILPDISALPTILATNTPTSKHPA